MTRKPHVRVETDRYVAVLAEVKHARLDDIASHLGVSQATARRRLDGLVARGVLRLARQRPREYAHVERGDLFPASSFLGGILRGETAAEAEARVYQPRKVTPLVKHLSEQERAALLEFAVEYGRELEGDRSLWANADDATKPVEALLCSALDKLANTLRLSSDW